jgi:hypothetical protein
MQFRSKEEAQEFGKSRFIDIFMNSSLSHKTTVKEYEEEMIPLLTTVYELGFEHGFDWHAATENSAE